MAAAPAIRIERLPIADDPDRLVHIFNSADTPERMSQAIINRGYNTCAKFTFSINSLETLERLLRNILFTNEQLGADLGVTEADFDLSLVVGSVRRAWTLAKEELQSLLS